MNLFRYTAIAALLLCFSLQARAQDSVQRGVTVHADPRLAVLLKKNHTMEPPAESPLSMDKHSQLSPVPYQPRERVVIYKGKGFRVQIYNGPDREKALKIKAEFMRHYPGVHTYLSYVAPSFRVKVGDYRNRSDAAGMLREANSMYTPTMIVPDMIVVMSY
jgi:hypothetical protein